MTTLYDALLAYGKSDVYPFHMPGHKRQVEDFENPFLIDITEIDGFDNLHHPEGILKEAQERAAEVYGSRSTYFLVNGSTCGILSAVSALVRPGGEIGLARNCHKASYHACYLGDLVIHSLYPQWEPKFGINGGILPEDVEKLLKDYPKTQAVLITSPTYDGAVSDVKRIAEICHAHGISLIVDEAHGAHLGFCPYFPESALKLGADVVIQSFHKTLPSFTQTAVLHVSKSARVDEDRIRRFLGIYQSSSPSYVLMASIDACVDLIERDGEELFAKHVRELKNFRESCRELKWLYLAGLDSEKDGIWQLEAKLAELGQTADFDRSKLLISARRANLAGAGLTGEELSRILRERYHIQMEMSGPDYVVGIAGIADSEEGFGRLAEALHELDQDMDEKIPVDVNTADKVSAKSNALPRLKAVLTIGEAAEAEGACRPLAACEGAVAGNYVYLYPPGIPVLAPGERVTEELLKCIEEWLEAGYEVHGLKYDGDGIPKLGIVKE